MIIVMRASASDEQVAATEAKVKASGLEPHTIIGTERKVIAVVGDERELNSDQISVMPGVDKVLGVLAPYKLASQESTVGRSQIDVGGVIFGGKKIPVIAGPCSVESREQILESARAAKAGGATMLRGGAYKPRTSPYSFQGMAEDGLKLLAEAREATGLPVVTEVLSVESMPIVAEYADMLQIGARNMQNFLLLKAAGQTNRPVFLKRGMSASIEEMLLAAEYILREGNPNVILCERGIRTFETHTRNTLPLASVPALQERSHLPVVVDPSHGTGRISMVPAMAKAAIAAGADGLMIEAHPDPASAWSDGDQSLDFEAFAELMPQLRRVAEAVDREL